MITFRIWNLVLRSLLLRYRRGSNLSVEETHENQNKNKTENSQLAKQTHGTDW